jgi:hypothetical protein
VASLSDLGGRETRDGFAVPANLCWIGVRRQGVTNYFECNAPVQSPVVGKIHFTHSANTEQRADLITTKIRTFCEGHEED